MGVRFAFFVENHVTGENRPLPASQVLSDCPKQIPGRHLVFRDVNRDVVVVRMSAFARACGCLITKQVRKTVLEREQEVISTVFTSSDPFAGPIVFDWVVSVEALWRFVRSLTIPAWVTGAKSAAIPRALPGTGILSSS